MDDVQEEPEEEKEEEAPEPAPNMKKIVKKGKAPVDELCSLAGKHNSLSSHAVSHCEVGSHHVYVDGSGVAWDATLNQTDVRAQTASHSPLKLNNIHRSAEITTNSTTANFWNGTLHLTPMLCSVVGDASEIAVRLRCTSKASAFL